MSKKALFALLIGLSIGGTLPPPLSGLFGIAAAVTLFRFIIRVLDDAGEPDFTPTTKNPTLFSDGLQTSPIGDLANSLWSDEV